MNIKTTKRSGKRAGVKNLTGVMIRQCREKRGWTQYRLADAFRKLGVPTTRCIIANIETQRCPVTDYQLLLFARILGVSWKSLFPEKNTLDKLIPQLVAGRPAQAHKRKPSPQNPRSTASRNQWAICEMACKAVKITFKHAS